MRERERDKQRTEELGEHKAGGGGEYELINIHKRKIIGNVKCIEVGKVIKIVKAVEIVEIDWKGSMCVCVRGGGG